MRKSRSTDDYFLGFHSYVEPLLEPESPKPGKPIRYGRCEVKGQLLGKRGLSVDSESLPSLVKTLGATGLGESLNRIPEASDRDSKCLTRRCLIPTISVDSLDHVPRKVSRRPSLESVASFAPSEMSFRNGVEKSQVISSRIHQLVSAFSERARGIKERIAQPPTPSSTSSSKADEAPDPPPLSLRHDSLIATYEPLETNDNFYISIKRCSFPKTIDPQSWLSVSWLIIVSAAFAYNAWGITLRASFPYQSPGNLYLWLVADYLCDFVYLLDMVLYRPKLRFLRDGFWVDDLVDIRKNYVQSTRFKLDLIAILPLDLLYLFFGINPLFRLARVLKILPFWELFDRLDMMLSSAFFIRVTRTLFYMVFLIHINACAYYGFSEAEGLGNTTFVFQGKGNAYLRCFYFAMKTATKIGKNPKPVNDDEYAFMIFNWIIGVFACAAIIGQIHDIMSAAEQQETEYRDTLDRTINCMNRLNLPDSIQSKVRAWFAYNWNQQRTLDEGASLRTLPHKLQTDIALNVHINTLSKVKLFQDCDKALLRDLVLKLKPVLFLPGDLVCKKGEVGKEMYIVQMGHLEVLGGPNNDLVLVTLQEGSVFGEISLLAIGGGNRRTADVRSKGFSNLFVLSKHDLNIALQDHPEAQKILQRKAKKLIKQNVARDKSAETTPVNPVIGTRPETPKFVRTVLQAVPRDSGAAQLLLSGSRTNLNQAGAPAPRRQSSQPESGGSSMVFRRRRSLSRSFSRSVEEDEISEIIKIETTDEESRWSYGEVLLTPSGLASSASSAFSQTRHFMRSFLPSSRVAPLANEDPIISLTEIRK